jgi:IclR family pca regulon transcriptional regulator
MAVLEAVADGGPSISLAALSRKVNKSKPTTWRLVHTFVKLGYVRQDPATREFSLTPHVLALGTWFEGMDMKDLAGDFLRRLSTEIGETVNMAVLDGDRLIYIERVKTTQVVNINLHVGSSLPLYNTSMGRVLLAFMPDAQLRQYLARLAADPVGKKYSQHGSKRLLDILEETRRRGYALNDEELVSGLRSVAAPIWDSSDRLAAAINISVPSVRVSVRQLRVRYVPELLATATEISAALGHSQARRNLREVVNERRRRIV